MPLPCASQFNKLVHFLVMSWHHVLGSLFDSCHAFFCRDNNPFRAHCSLITHLHLSLHQSVHSVGTQWLCYKPMILLLCFVRRES